MLVADIPACEQPAAYYYNEMMIMEEEGCSGMSGGWSVPVANIPACEYIGSLKEFDDTAMNDRQSTG